MYQEVLVTVLFTTGLLIAVFVGLDILRRRIRGDVCDWCAHFEKMDNAEICNTGLFPEPLPLLRTCWSFERRRRRRRP